MDNEIYTTVYILENYKNDKKITINELTMEQRSYFSSFHINIYHTLYHRHRYKSTIYKEKSSILHKNKYQKNKEKYCEYARLKYLKDREEILKKYHNNKNNPLSVITI